MSLAIHTNPHAETTDGTEDIACAPRLFHSPGIFPQYRRYSKRDRKDMTTGRSSSAASHIVDSGDVGVPVQCPGLVGSRE
jgi:hypothetical protein